MIGFVDDTGGSTNDFLHSTQMPLEHYLSLAENDAQRWNDVLSVSGAALNDSKCSYHFLNYEFSLSGIAFARGTIVDPVLTIKYNSSSVKNRLKPMGNYDAHKTLGTWKAPAGDDVIGSQKLLEKNRHHVQIIANSPFDRKDVWTYYHSVYLPSITYLFPLTDLLPNVLSKMSKELRSVMLPRYRYNRNTPLAIVHGCSSDAGIGLRDLALEKGIAQVTHLMTALRTEGITRELSLVAISWMQLLAGTSFPVFQEVQTNLPHLSPMKWLPAIRKFLLSQDMWLELEETFFPELQRVNDAFIMDIALDLHYSNNEIQRINACRLYKGVTLISDITNVRGNKISENKT